jgi:hypothetical protein
LDIHNSKFKYKNGCVWWWLHSGVLLMCLRQGVSLCGVAKPFTAVVCQRGELCCSEPASFLSFSTCSSRRRRCASRRAALCQHTHARARGPNSVSRTTLPFIMAVEKEEEERETTKKRVHLLARRRCTNDADWRNAGHTLEPDRAVIQQRRQWKQVGKGLGRRGGLHRLQPNAMPNRPTRECVITRSFFRSPSRS